MNHLIFAFLFGSAVILISVPSLSQTGLGDDMDWGDNTSQAGLDKAKHRLYKGGRDEQDIEVQASLPRPSRHPDRQDEVAASSHD